MDRAWYQTRRGICFRPGTIYHAMMKDRVLDVQTEVVEVAWLLRVSGSGARPEGPEVNSPAREGVVKLFEQEI